MGILQARILEWVNMPSSRGSSQHKVRTQVSCIAGRFFTVCVIREAQLKLVLCDNLEGWDGGVAGGRFKGCYMHTYG